MCNRTEDRGEDLAQEIDARHRDIETGITEAGAAHPDTTTEAATIVTIIGITGVIITITIEEGTIGAIEEVTVVARGTHSSLAEVTRKVRGTPVMAMWTLNCPRGKMTQGKGR